jgi:hypothetical protein
VRRLQLILASHPGDAFTDCGLVVEFERSPINVNGPNGRSNVACWIRVAFRAANSTS